MIKFIFILILLITFSNSYSQFVIQNTPATNYMTSISSPSNNVAWASGDSLQVIRTTNSGLNWTTANGDLPTNLRFFHIWAIDSLTAHLCISNAFFTAGYIYKTSNGGINWIKTWDGGAFINAVSFINSTTGFAAGDPAGGRWTLLKTTNGGNNWDSTGMYFPVSNSELGLANSLFYKGSRLWFGTQSGKICSSFNNGANWNTTQTILGDVRGIFFNDSENGKGLAVSDYYSNGNNIVKTNNGTNWAFINSLPPNERVPGISGIPGSSNYWLLFPKTILRSTDEGLTWNIIYNNVSTYSFKDIAVSRTGLFPRTIYAIRHDKKILVGNSDISSAIILISNQLPINFQLFQNYPNPFNPSTNINYELPSSNFVSLKVYDINGKEIETLVNENQNAGSYSVTFNAANYPSGVYFYKLETNNFFETKKMVLVK